MNAALTLLGIWAAFGLAVLAATPVAHAIEQHYAPTVGSNPRNNQPPTARTRLATRGFDRAVGAEPEPGNEQLSTAVPRSRPNGGEHTRRPDPRKRSR